MCEVITKSLIREFMIRRNLNKSLEIFDQEFQLRQTQSRIEIIQQLGLERIVRRNNESPNQLKTILEILISHLLSKKAHLEALTLQTVPEKIEDIQPIQIQQNATRQNKMKQRPQSEYRPKLIQTQDDFQEIIEQEADLHQYQNEPQKASIQNEPQQQQSEKAESKQIQSKDSSKIMDLSVSSSHSQQKQYQQIPPKQFTFKRRSENSLHKEKESILNESHSQQIAPIANLIDDPIQYKQIDLKNHNLTVNIEYLLNYNKSVMHDPRKRKPMTRPIQGDVKKLLFQGLMNSLPSSWAQGFIFIENQTFFGLHQLEGGPCGVLAAVQAYYLKHFLFLQNTYENRNVKENCLMAALTDILHKVNPNRLILAVPVRNSFSDVISVDSCEELVYQDKTFQQKYDILLDNKQMFFDKNGVTLFFYSVILTKGYDQILQEMDQKFNSLIGNHGHCTQESVNLMLTGQATSNCFDGTKVLDGEISLKGISQRSEIGFLTLFEYQNYVQVGANYKNPKLPIWVICKEHHYSIVFGCDYSVIDNTENLNKNLKEFDLIFYDGLNNPNDLIRLTIRRLGAQKGNQNSKSLIQGLKFEQSEKITPSIEQVLSTKYGPLEIDWNDSIPIL
ncbi:hypothetical protein pb186bvf_001354 [Paramecium bursaria]